MHYKHSRWLLLLAMLALMVVGCSDDDDSNPTGGTNTPTAQTPAVVETITELTEGPLITNLAQAGDPNGYGSVAAIYISMASMANAWMIPPPSASKEILPSLALSDTVTYTWSDGMLTISMLWIETSTEYVWKVVVDGTDGTDVFVNFVMIEAHQDLTGTSGWMEMYDPDLTGAFLRWEWSESGGVFTMTMTGVDGVDTWEVTLVVNADGSGYVEVTDGTEYWKITWNAAGTSGTWTDGVDSGAWPYTG